MFYFTPSRVASFFRSNCPSLTEYVYVFIQGEAYPRSHISHQVGAAQRWIQCLAFARGCGIDQDQCTDLVCS